MQLSKNEIELFRKCLHNFVTQTDKPIYESPKIDVTLKSYMLHYSDLVSCEIQIRTIVQSHS